ncbi:MAG: coenzyme F420-0:L-glutamate ligase, partial [Chloroflexi bacterium]
MGRSRERKGGEEGEGGTVTLVAIPGIPLIQPGDDLAAIILERMAAAGLAFRPGDILVVCQKVISKAEGRLVRLAEVTPSPEAVALAARAHKDPRLVELILRESRAVLRVRPGLIIVEHRLGWVCANAGIDRSNVAEPEDDGWVLLLPEDPDRSARALHQRLHEATGVPVAVIVNDSHGRPFRLGAVGVAIGVAGLAP